MNSLTAYSKIKKLNWPYFSTDDIAGYLGVSKVYAYKILKQLEFHELLVHLKRNVWYLLDDMNVLLLPELISSPSPAYVSLQTALHLHGIIEQIPSVIYAIVLSRAYTYHSPLGEISFHKIQPDLFTGYERKSDVNIAIPEKALFDFFYLKCTKSKLFYSLPEIQLPDEFDITKLYNWAELIKNPSRKSMVLNQFQKYLRRLM